MVRGLDVFRSFFAAYSGQYVLIGGTAASLAMDEAGLAFRSTKDLDIVLHVEAMSAEFGHALWSFVENGGYRIRESNSGKPNFYRFEKPSDDTFPAMLELFSRAPDGLKLPGGCHLSPIRIDKDISSLSAILLDDAYYHFVMSQRKETGGLSWVGAECLIPLKAIAWLELSTRKESGEPVDSKVVNKHRKDVIQLSQLLVPAQRVEVAAKIYGHLSSFLNRLDGDASVNRKQAEEVIDRITQVYISTEA